LSASPETEDEMLRTILIAIAVLFVLRFVARLTAPRPPAAGGMPGATQPERAPRRRPALSDAERERLEVEREAALREGRQIDAIKLHRQLTGLDLVDAEHEMDARRGR
jgi:ribosomal protein L7/L12